MYRPTNMEMRMQKVVSWSLVTVVVSAAMARVAWAQPVAVPHTFSPNTPALAAEVNANFDALAAALQGITGGGHTYWVSTAQELEDAVASSALTPFPPQITQIFLMPGLYDVGGTMEIDGWVALTSITPSGSPTSFFFQPQISMNGAGPVIRLLPNARLFLHSVAVSHNSGEVITCDQLADYVEARQSMLFGYVDGCSINLNESHANAVTVYNQAGTAYPRVWLRNNASVYWLEAVNAYVEAHHSRLGGSGVSGQFGVSISGIAGGTYGASALFTEYSGIVDLVVTGKVFSTLLFTGMNAPIVSPTADGTPQFSCRGNYDGIADLVCP